MWATWAEVGPNWKLGPEATVTLSRESFMGVIGTRCQRRSDEHTLEVRLVNVPGRMHPVQIYYTPAPEPDFLEAALIAVLQLHLSRPRGDVLVFLPGQDRVGAHGRHISTHRLAAMLGDPWAPKHAGPCPGDHPALRHCTWARSWALAPPWKPCATQTSARADFRRPPQPVFGPCGGAFEDSDHLATAETATFVATVGLGRPTGRDALRRAVQYPSGARARCVRISISSIAWRLTRIALSLASALAGNGCCRSEVSFLARRC